MKVAKEAKKKLDLGLIRTDAPEGTRFLVLRIRPLCHQAYWFMLEYAPFASYEGTLEKRTLNY
jgi:hypothetical protein